VTIGGIIEHEYFGHDGVPFWVWIEVFETKAVVMPGLVPGIHVLQLSMAAKDVDGRDNPGPDGVRY
jgi:hypothetical protein